MNRTGLSKCPSQNRMLQSTKEQFLDVAVPQVMEQWREGAKTASHDRNRQETFEQFADIPGLREVEEPVFKVFFPGHGSTALW